MPPGCDIWFDLYEPLLRSKGISRNQRECKLVGEACAGVLGTVAVAEAHNFNFSLALAFGVTIGIQTSFSTSIRVVPYM